jgi:tetratricopeptide (TPR) repeat protein
MEQLADPGSTLLTPDTLALAEGFVQVTSLCLVAVKGLTTAVEVYELAGISAARSRLQAAAARGLSRFVGRDVEIEHLRRALGLAGSGRGQIVAVVGEPGVGKSRLTFELTHSHRVEGWVVVEAGSVSYGKATSYLPVIDLLKGYFRIADRDTPREIREKVTGKVLALDRALEMVLPALLALLEVAGEDLQWQALDPPQRRQRTLDAVKRLLLREAQVQPLLVVFEDLHWIDSETQAVLDSLVESLPPARLFLLVNYRPEYAHRWGSKASYTQVRLDPLPPESALELLHSLLGKDATIEPLKPILIARTEGNPFFMEESIRTLAETNALVGGRGTYRLTTALTDIQVPPTVQAILAARIDRLSAEEKHLLQSAAVIGKDVPFPLLAAITDDREEEVRRGLTHLQTAEFLYEVSLFPDLEYTFKHALTHEVAYGGLLHERRRGIHARVVEVIEALYGDRLAEHVERVANHALRGEAWGKAVRYASEAGQKAAARRAHREAVTWFEHALAALAKLPDTAERQTQAIDLRLDIRSSLVSLGDFAGVPFHLRQAAPIAKALGDEDRQSAIASALAHCSWATGQYQEGLQAGQHALELATRAENPARQRTACFVLGEIRHALGDYDQAIAHFVGNIEAESLDETLRWRQDGPAIFSVVNRRWVAMSLAEVGRFTDAIALGTEAVEIAETADHPYSLINALVGLGFALVRKGDVDRAIPLLERGCEVSATLGFTMWSTCATPLAAAYGLAGRSSDAARVLADPRVEPRSVTGSVAQSYLLGGYLDEARRLAEQELDLGRAQKSQAKEAWALYALGELAAYRDPFDVEAGENYLRQALVLAGELGMRPLIAHCHLGLGKLYRRTGKRQEAQEHLTTATTMYREMDMRFWLEQAEADRDT